MSDKDIRKAYNNLSQRVNQPSYNLQTIQEKLQHEFDTLNSLICVYEEKKQEMKQRHI